MSGARWQGLTAPVLTGSTFDGHPFQIALSASGAFDRGASAGIYKGQLLASEPLVVAVKVFNMLGPIQKELLVRELRTARQVSLRHHLILAFLGTADVGDQKAIVSLYMQNGNLKDYLVSHRECNKKPLILQVAEAVNYLHTIEGLVHGDLKCANVLISDYGDALLADFGLSTFAEKTQHAVATMTGIRQLHTLRFAAPELLFGTAPQSKTRESDVYAFGMLVLEAITERPPWDGMPDLAVMLEVSSRRHPPQPKLDPKGPFVSLSHFWWDVCRRCWSRTPGDRPQMQDVAALLRDADLDPRRRLHGHADSVHSVAYLPGQRRVVSASHDRTIRIWDTLTGRTVVGPLHGHKARVYSVALSPDGRQLCSGGGDRTIRRWDAASGASIGEPMTGHSGEVNSVAFSADGTRIVSGSDDETVHLCDATTGGVLRPGPLAGHTDWVWSVTFSSDGMCIASGSRDGTVRLWDSATGESLGVLHHPETRVYSVCFCPDRTHLVSGCWDGVVRIWDISTRQLVRSINAHSNLVNSVAVSSSGRYLASGSFDSIRIWDAQTGDAVGAPLTGPTDWILSVAFSPDGRSLVSGSTDGTVRIWDVFE